MPIQFHEDDSEVGGGDLTPRTATVKIRSVEEYHSKAGKVWIRVNARTTDDGEWLNEYLPPKRGTVVMLCASAGVEAPQDGTLNEELLAGCECRVKLKVEPAKDGYPAKYRVEKWLPAGQPAQAVPGSKPLNFTPKGPAITTGKAAKPQAVVADEMDGIPF
jgi:hypothetical protein